MWHFQHWEVMWSSRVWWEQGRRGRGRQAWAWTVAELYQSTCCFWNLQQKCTPDNMGQCLYATSQCSCWAQKTMLDFPCMDWLILVYCRLLIIEQLEQFIGWGKRRGRGNSCAYFVNCSINCPTSSKIFFQMWSSV